MKGRHTQEYEKFCHSQIYSTLIERPLLTKHKTHKTITKWLAKGKYLTKEICKWLRSTCFLGPTGAAWILHTSQHLSPSKEQTQEKRQYQGWATGELPHSVARGEKTHVPPFMTCSSKATQYDACGSAGSLCTNRNTHRRKNKPFRAHSLGLWQQGRTSRATQGKQVHCAHTALKG